MSDNPLGELVSGWGPPERPGTTELSGRFVHLSPLSAQQHAADLYQAFQGKDAVWDYMPVGPFHSSAQFYKWVSDITANNDFVFLRYVIWLPVSLVVWQAIFGLLLIRAALKLAT